MSPSTRWVKPTKVISIGILGAGIRLTCKVVDLSMTGVMARCLNVVSAGTSARIGIESTIRTICATGVARRSLPDLGTAFEFSQMASHDRQVLRRVILSSASFTIF